MAYQPPNKSPYGDTELTDDGWTRTSATSQADYPTRGPAHPQHSPLASNQVYGQSLPPGSRLLHEQPQNFNAIASSMSQDDILFMRNVRQECFFYRILPINMLAAGSLYTYNKYKQLPHKVGRYAGLLLLSSVTAVSTFRETFKKRVAESRLNTPYMQTMRKVMNISPVADDFAGDYGMEYGRQLADGSSSNWDATDLSGDPRFNGKTSGTGFSDSSNLDSSFYQPLDQPQENQGLDRSTQATSYEELRARNRGYIK